MVDYFNSLAIFVVPVNGRIRAGNPGYVNSTGNHTRNTPDMASIEKAALAWDRPSSGESIMQAGAFTPECRKREC